MIFKPHVSIGLDSRLRTKGSIESFTSYLSHQIKFSQKPSRIYFMRLENVQMPKSYYDVNSNFNTFQVIETSGGTVTITIDEGNYTITELLTELEAALDANTTDGNNYTLSYDDVSNKVTISAVFGTSTVVTIDTIANGSTLNQLLGFGKADTDKITGGDTTTVLADSTDKVAPNCVNLRTQPAVIIETDVTSENYYNQSEQLHIGCRVPMIVDRNEFQFFSNDNGHLTRMNSKAPLSQLSFQLKDVYGNIMDLCNVDWQCEVVIYELVDTTKK